MKRGALSRREILRGGTLVLLLGTQQIARGATIVAVRVWPAPEYSRVTIESDGQLSSTQIVMTHPPRLAVKLLRLGGLEHVRAVPGQGLHQVRHVFLAAGTDKQFRALCSLLERSDLLELLESDNALALNLIRGLVERVRGHGDDDVVGIHARADRAIQAVGCGRQCQHQRQSKCAGQWSRLRRHLGPSFIRRDPPPAAARARPRDVAQRRPRRADEAE